MTAIEVIVIFGIGVVVAVGVLAVIVLISELRNK